MVILQTNIAPSTPQGAPTDPSHSEMHNALNGRFNQLYVVAANDSSAEDKAAATAICDGTADNVEIQAAIDSGELVYVCKGIYHTTSPIVISGYNRWIWFEDAALIRYTGSTRAFTLSGFHQTINLPMIVGMTAATAPYLIGYYALHFPKITGLRAAAFEEDTVNPHDAIIKFDTSLHSGTPATDISGGGIWDIGFLNYLPAIDPATGDTGLPYGAVAANAKHGIWLHTNSNDHWIENEHFRFMGIFGGTETCLKVGNLANPFKCAWCLFEGELDSQSQADILIDCDDHNNTFWHKAFTTGETTSCDWGAGTQGNVVYFAKGVLAPDPIIVNGANSANKVNWWREYAEEALEPVAGSGFGWQSDTHGSLIGQAHQHLPDGSTTAIVHRPIFKPKGMLHTAADNVKLIIIWSSTAASNVVRFRSIIEELAAVGATSGVTRLSQEDDATAAGVANTTNETIINLTSIPGTGPLFLYLERMGGHTNDTNTGQVSIWSVRIQFLGAMSN